MISDSKHLHVKEISFVLLPDSLMEAESGKAKLHANLVNAYKTH